MTNRMPKTGPHRADADAERVRQADRRLHHRQGRRRALHDLGLVGRRRNTTCAGSRQHLPKDGSVRIAPLRPDAGRAVASPGRSRAELLQKLIDDDVSTKAFRFMDFREMEVGGAPCMVNRITYTGDLGYEIWMAPAYQRLLYARDQGGRARSSASSISACARCCRCGWRRTSRPGSASCGRSTAPFEGGMERFIKLEKNDFVGREAAREGAGGRPEAAARLADRRGDRRRRDGRRADLGEGRTAGLRHGRQDARLRRAALRRRRQGSARLDGGDRRVGRARPASTATGASSAG